MKLLALDSTENTAAVAITDGETLIAQTVINAGRSHSELLLPAIQSIMNASRLSYSDIDAFVCSSGPGSFTGVRIGVATAKGLAFGRELPCAGVSSLEALATNLLDRDAYICAAMDARRNQLYYAIFKTEGGKLTRLCPDTADGADKAASAARELGINDIICVGDGAEIAASAMKDAEIRTSFPTATLLRQNAYGTAICGLNAYREGKAVDETELLPIYLRDFGDGK